MGACNEIKFELDKCFKAEKKRLLSEMNKDLPELMNRQEEIVKEAFGKEMTFSEFLQKDKVYRAEVAKKQQHNQQQGE